MTGTTSMICAFPVPAHDLEAKVSELDFRAKVLCLSSYLKKKKRIQSLREIYLIFGIMIGIGQRILSAPSLPLTLRSKS